MVQNVAIMTTLLLGGGLAFVVWRMGEWIKGIAKALGELVDVVGRDLDMRCENARERERDKERT